MRKWLYDIRKEKKLTQAEVAYMSGIARTTYSMIETGERGVSVQNAKAISITLGFSWTIFFDESCHESCNISKGVI